MRCSKQTLFDHLVDAGVHGRRDVEAERLGGLEVEDHLVLCRRLHRQVGRLLASENAVNITCGPPIKVEYVGAVVDQSALRDVVAAAVHGGQAVTGSECDDQTALVRANGGCHDHASIRVTRKVADSALDLASVAHVYRYDVDAEQWCSRLEDCER